MAARRSPTRRKTAVRKPTRRKASPRKTARKKTTRSKTPHQQAAAAPTRVGRKRVDGWPAKVLSWSPTKAVMTFPYRAFRWVSDVAEDYRSFVVALDRSPDESSPPDARPASSTRR